METLVLSMREACQKKQISIAILQLADRRARNYPMETVEYFYTKIDS